MSKRERAHTLEELHFKIERLDASKRDGEIAKLDHPWIGQEGPLEADFFRYQGSKPLLQRGIAFAGDVTVHWDEAGVRVLKLLEGKKPGCIAIQSEAHVHPRFHHRGLERLLRTDFLTKGVYEGSHYRAIEGGESDA